MDAGTDTNLAESGYPLAVDDALDALVTEPETEAPEHEAAEIETDDIGADDAAVDDAQIDPVEEDGSTEADEPQAITLDDSDLDTEIMVNDEVVSIRALVEAYDNREAPELLQSERQELESKQSQLEQKLADYDYVNDEKVPHTFLTKALTKMVEEGDLPEQAYAMISDVFVQLKKQGLYSPEQAQAKADAAAKQAEFEQQSQKIEEERRALQTDKEIAQVEREHGELTADVAHKLVEFIKREHAKTGQVITLVEAASRNKALFNKPAPSKRKLADRLRSSTPQTSKPRKLSAAEALDDLYRS